MGKDSTFLLDEGDELHLSESVTLIYRPCGKVKPYLLTAIQEQEKHILSSQYLVTDRLLGVGAYGKVLVGIDQNTHRQVACKMVNLQSLYDRRTDPHSSTNDGRWTLSQALSRLSPKLQSCFREFDTLKDLSHPNIIQIQKVFWSESTIYLFQELVTGGDLFSYVEYKHGKVPTIESAVIIRQILKGVQYLHDHDVVHRDLKPDNILMTSLNSGARIVITDFGHARFLPKTDSQHRFANKRQKRMFSVAGTLEYAAPEIHRANDTIPAAYGYSLSVDMWSIGSITAAILTGQLLFSCRRGGAFEESAQRVIISLAAQCDLTILDDEYHPLWGPIAAAPKDFIKRLLVLDEECRMSATEALQHIWFSHPAMAAEYEAQYERSIKHWRPRLKDGQLVEQVRTHERVPSHRPNSDSQLFNDTFQRFSTEHASIHDDLADTHNNAQCPRAYDQFASQPRSPSSGNGDAAREGFSLGSDPGVKNGRTNTGPESVGQQQQHPRPILDDQLIPQKRQYEALKKVVDDKLQRVSTSTLAAYFQREAVNLDDLDGPTKSSGKSLEAINIPYSKVSRSVQPRPRGPWDNTNVGTRKTPDEGSDASGGVDRW